MSGNPRSKGLLITWILENSLPVRKWNEEHPQRQIRVGQVVLKVILGRGLNHVKRWELGMGIEHRPSRSSSPIFTSFHLHGPAVNMIKKRSLVVNACLVGVKLPLLG